MARDIFGHLFENAFFNAARGCRILDTPAHECRICCQHWSSAGLTSTENRSHLFIFDESCSLICVGLGSAIYCAACSSMIAISDICVTPDLDSETEPRPSIGRRTATAEAAVVEHAARARRAAIERPRGRRRRSAAPPRERGLASAPLRRGHAGGARLYEMAATDVTAMYFFAAQLPSGMHPDIFFARDDGRVVVQLPHNYPAAAHCALFFICDDRHRCHGDVFFAAQLPGRVNPGTFFAGDDCRVVG